MKLSRITIVFNFLIVWFFSISLAQTDLEKNDNELATLIQTAKTGIVAIGTFHFNMKPKAQFFGTGFIIENGDRIVTNHHVIASIKKENRLFNLRVFHDIFPKNGMKATILAEDEIHDLAILGIEGLRLRALPLEKNKRVEEGHRVVFTGYPIGFVPGMNPTTHTGIISSITPNVIPSPSAENIKGDLIKHLKDPFDIFQIDATAYPGNSGSPVYRITNGQVVGVINMVFIKGKKEHALKNPTGITYAIPVKFVHELIQSIQ